MVKEFDRMAREWASKDSSHPDNYIGALRCAIYLEAWRQMGWNLRKPRLCREEMERYES